MDKDQLVEEFFRSFRVALTNAFSYSKDHPYFIKSVENFKLKLETLLAIFQPLKIGVTSLGLVVDGKNLTRSGFYDELARLLHQRKIKNITIKSGVTLEQTVGFFSLISMSPKDIFKNGGIKALLNQQALVNFIIEELDYSAFLQEQGEECNDAWGYLLKEAVEGADPAKLNNLADNFSGLIKHTNQNEIFATAEIPANINNFLISLRNQDQEKFAKCSKDLFLWLLRNKETVTEEKLAKLKQVFDSLKPEDFSNLFWEGISQEEKFDALSLQFFSKISEQKNPTQIAQGIFKKINSQQQLNSNPKVAKRMQDLLSSAQDDQISAVYRNTLESLVKGISFSGDLSFDQQALKANYRYIVLDILATDKDQDILLQAAEILEKALESIFKDNDLNFLKDLYDQLLRRKNEQISVLLDLEKKISLFVENIILNQDLSLEQECLLGMISGPSQEVNFYLNKIFSGQKINRSVLSLFFKFYPGNLDIFYQKVEGKLQDLEFMFSLIEALGQLSLPVTLGILDYIYSSSNELIKVKILNIMHKLKRIDAEFLQRQLNTDSYALRKNLLSVLILDPHAVEGALDFLLKDSSFWGRKNQRLIENMQIVFDLGLKQAISRIQDLSSKGFFWNYKLRIKAKLILKEWNAH